MLISRLYSLFRCYPQGFLAAGVGVWLALTAGCGTTDAMVLEDLRQAAASGQPNWAERHTPDTRRQAVQGVAESEAGGQASFVQAYRQLLNDPDPLVRAAAARALRRHGVADDARRIAPLLTDPSGFTRWKAARALQRLHHPAAIDPLIVALGDPDVDVRLSAARALGQYRQPRVFDALVGALDDRDFAVARAAEWSLQTLTGQSFGRDGRAWLAWAAANRRSLFDEGTSYTYRPFEMPPGVVHRVIVDPLLFWRGDDAPEPRAPTGLETP